MIASGRLYLLLVIAVLPFALSGLWPLAKTLGVFFDALIAILVLIDFNRTPKPIFVSASREVSDRLSIGRSNRVSLIVTNGSGSKLKCVVKDDFPRALKADTEQFEFELPPNAASALEYNVRPRRRGAYAFGNITVRYLSSFGLIWRQSKIKASRSVKVYSDLQTLHELSLKLARSTELGEMHQKKRGRGTDFASLKEYTVGDDSKAIDWKATARRDRPVMRTYEAEQEQRLLILVDAGRMMVSDLEGLTRFDHALNSALCLALTGLSHNDQVGVGIFADKPLVYLPARRGKSHLKKILEATFDVEPRMVEPDYAGILSYFASAQKGRCLMVVLTDLTDPVGSKALLAGLASLSSKHLPFCVTLKDRQVIKTAMRQVKSEELTQDNEIVEEIYRRAVATDLLAQREIALSVLQRRGCLVLDCPPQELTTKLLDSYLEIKATARL